MPPRKLLLSVTLQPILLMPKYKLKSGVSKETVVSYRTPKKGGMVTVLLGKASQDQLNDLGSIGHPFVTAERATSKSKDDS